jgi:hypothetical protein
VSFEICYVLVLVVLLLFLLLLLLFLVTFTINLLKFQLIDPLNFSIVQPFILSDQVQLTQLSQVVIKVSLSNLHIHQFLTEL